MSTTLDSRLDFRVSPFLMAERLQFETMLADLSSRFINLAADKIDSEIFNSLRLIAQVLEIDRCSVAEFDESKTRLRVTHAFAAPGATPMPDLVLNEQVPFYYRRLQQGESIVISRIDDLPPEARSEKAYCLQQGVKSSVLIPLAVGGAFLGVVGFANIGRERSWPEALVQRLRLVGGIFANALMRQRAEQKLYQAFSEINKLKDELEAENSYLREEITLQFAHDEFIGQSRLIKAVLSQVEQVAATDATVLIQGETGTGKEILAQSIHKMSLRRSRTMVTVNCATLPSELIESELFGHEKGAYTGAQSKRIGRFELADRSTLFLDEIGELSLHLQAKLLRVLQLKQFERLGGGETIHTNARVIAATNRNLIQAVGLGEFRMDLFYRLNVFPITIPPLRDRPEDIPPLVHFFVKYFSDKMGKCIDIIPRTRMNVLQAYHWPGNVRELKNMMERAVIITSGRTLQIEDPADPCVISHKQLTLNEMQKKYIIDTLNTTGWRIRGTKGAAEVLGIKPTTLESKMTKLGIQRPPHEARAKRN